MLRRLLFSLLLAIVTATPQLSYPFNSQVPPVARVGQEYSYVLPANTFSGYQTNVVYTLSNAPAWLTINSANRRLEGTPGTADIGSPSFDLVATDSSGVARDPIVLVVTADSGPQLVYPLQEQLRTIGNVDGLGGLVLAPESHFAIPFSRNTFADSGGDLSAFYGTSDNYTPLPSWIYFDPNAIVFTGTAPPAVSVIAPPQRFEFVLVGTDFPGFAGVSATFQIVVGAHQLSVNGPTSISLNATVGEAFEYKLPLSSISLDGTVLNPAQIVSAQANSSGTFLALDSATYTLRGTPAEAGTVIVTSTVLDTYGDQVAFTAIVNVQSNTTATTTSSEVFISQLPSTFNIAAGSYFSFTFGPEYVAASTNLSVSISGVDWLVYNSANRTLSGFAPADTTIMRRQVQSTPIVTVTAAAANGNSQTQTISVNVRNPSSTTSSDMSRSSTMSSSRSSSSLSASATTSSTATASSTNAASSSANSSGLSQKKKLAIGLGVTLPLLAILAALVLIYCCCCRNGRRSSRSSHSHSSSNISRPIEREKDTWPQAAGPTAYDEPRQLGTFQMFKSTSDEGRLSGYAMEVNSNGELAPPLAHELPPLPDSPSFDAVRSAYGADESVAGSSSSPHADMQTSRMANTSGDAITDSINHSGGQSVSAVTQGQPVNEHAPNRDSSNTMDSVVTDDVFSVRLVDERNAASLAPPLQHTDSGRLELAIPAIAKITSRRLLIGNSGTRGSAQTIGTYTSSEGGNVQRYGSQGESLSSGTRSQPSRNNSSQPHQWRVMNTQDSYGSFGSSYATTDSNLSDEFSFDESLSGSSNERRIFNQGIAEDIEGDGSVISRATKSTRAAVRPDSDAVLLQAPLGPDWATSKRQPLAPKLSVNERVLSVGKGKLRDTMARRPMSNASIGTPDTSGETSAEMAFV